ncbi:ABC transporter permease subunit [Jatrophihabitans sp.]|jgi:branched-subunit amino acid ABC-type transport system permease component|uniref:ABC transporter permease subunit n=1 Tax=Jatrophihabitans sp. TaxID=1932789 RepID=UPI002F1F4FF4
MISGVLLQVVLAGLAQGAVLGLMALGFSLVAGTARILPFAHGDIAVASIFLAVLAAVGATPTAARLAVLPSMAVVLLSLAAGVLLSGLVGALLVLLPDLAGQDGAHRRPDPLSWIVGGLAAGLLLRAVLGSALHQQAYALPDPLRIDALTPGGLVRFPGGSTVPVRAVCVLVLGLLIGLLAEAVLVRSRFGRSLRAVADDPAGAALCGVSARRAVLGAFLVAGLLAGLAGLLSAPGRALSVESGALLGLDAAAAALLGGIGSARGALAGGLVVGAVQTLAGYAFGSGFYDVAPLVLLAVALVLRPPAGQGPSRPAAGPPGAARFRTARPRTTRSMTARR